MSSNQSETEASPSVLLYVPRRSRSAALTERLERRGSRYVTDNVDRRIIFPSRSCCVLISWTEGHTLDAVGWLEILPGGVTRLRSIKVFRIRDFNSVPVEHLESLLDSGPAPVLSSTRLLSAEEVGHLLQVLHEHYPNANRVINRAINEFTQLSKLEANPERRNAKHIHQLESEAFVTALYAANWQRDKEVIQDIWHPYSEKDSAVPPFLKTLNPKRNVREDLTILADWQHIDERWKQLARYPHSGTITFKLGQRNISIVYANQQPLEQTLGVDLIYFSRLHNSYTCVQYKRLASGGRAGNGICRIDDQLLKQLDQMERWQSHLLSSREAVAPSSELELRLSEDPFYLKLCPQLQETRVASMSEGFYIPRSSMNYFRNHSSYKIGAQSRWLNNQTFINLISNGWLGTTQQSSDLMQRIIQSSLNSKRSITIADVSGRDARGYDRPSVNPQKAKKKGA